MISQLNSTSIYLICGAIIAFVAAVCVVFMARAYRAGLMIGMDRAKLNRTLTSSVTFSILPSSHESLWLRLFSLLKNSHRLFRKMISGYFLFLLCYFYHMFRNDVVKLSGYRILII